MNKGGARSAPSPAFDVTYAYNPNRRPWTACASDDHQRQAGRLPPWRFPRLRASRRAQSVQRDEEILGRGHRPLSEIGGANGPPVRGPCVLRSNAAPSPYVRLNFGTGRARRMTLKGGVRHRVRIVFEQCRWRTSDTIDRNSCLPARPRGLTGADTLCSPDCLKNPPAPLCEQQQLA